MTQTHNTSITIRLPRDLVAKLDAARATYETRSQALRRLLLSALFPRDSPPLPVPQSPRKSPPRKEPSS